MSKNKNLKKGVIIFYDLGGAYDKEISVKLGNTDWFPINQEFFKFRESKDEPYRRYRVDKEIYSYEFIHGVFSSTGVEVSAREVF